MRGSGFWWAVPRALVEARVPIAVAALVVSVLPAGALVAVGPEDLARELGRMGAGLLAGDSYIQSLEPERRSAIPERIAGVVAGLLWPLAVATIVGGAALAAALVPLFGRLGAVLAEQPPTAPAAASRRAPASWMAWTVFAAGMAAHLPYLLLSLNLDEAVAVPFATQGAWGWADTRLGWQSHVGGLLLVRLHTLAFGVGEWTVRLPAAMASSLGLVVVFAWAWRHAGPRAAAASVLLIGLLPLWGDQAATCRGYGLLFLGGALTLSGLWDLWLEEDPGDAAIARTATGILAGGLAQFFFFFLGLTTLVLLVVRALRDRRPAAAAAAVWCATALGIAGLFYLPGLPSTLYHNSLPPGEGHSTAIGRSFLFDAMLRRSDAAGLGTALALAVTGVAGLRQTPSRERRLVASVLVGAVGVPFAMQPFYVYPRFFVHLLPLLYLGGRAFETLPRWTLALAGIGLLAVAQPWAALPMVDLRGAARHCAEVRAAGGRCAVGGGLRGIEFYARGVARVASLERRIPVDATVLVTTTRAGSRAPGFVGFEDYARLPGWDEDVVFLRRVPPVP